MSTMDTELTAAEEYYFGGGAAYDPEAPVPYWHQRMELITICVCNGLTRESFGRIEKNERY